MDEPKATSEVSKKISSINKEAVHRICSGQVVLDLAIAVKELVENSLDSGATLLEIKLIDYGKTCITVIDNGSGVLEEDFEGLGLKHHTSKLREFSDLLEVDTFGFRGEALSSLCALSNLCIVTRHSTSPHAFDLQFDKNGTLIKKRECARQQGTTVYVKNIFKNLPVRAKEFERNIKKEFSKMIQVIYSYCLVSTGVKINCSNALRNKSANVVVSTSGSARVLDNIVAVFGRKAREYLIEIELKAPDKDTLEEYNLPEKININFSWKCFVSSCNHTAGRSSPDRQFLYINGRPCDLMKITKLINHTYHKYNNKQYPFVYLNIKLEKSCADVNVTPDKRTILLTQEKLILATIKSNFDKTWDSAQGTFTIRRLDEMNFRINKRSLSDSPDELPLSKKPFIHDFSYSKNNIEQKCVPAIQDIKNKLSKFKSSETTSRTIPKSIQQNHPELINTKFQKTAGEEKVNIHDTKKLNDENQEQALDGEKNIRIEINKNSKLISKFKYDQEFHTKQKEKDIEEPVIRPQMPNVQMTISLKSIRTKIDQLKNIQKSKENTQNDIKYRTHLDSKSSDIEKELERELTKESFMKMQIIGQFNLGFILTKLGNDIFIIDQHASDEKFRFEKLSSETKLKTQRLIAPKPLNLAILNETIVAENQHVFEDNGFTFCINFEEEPGHRVNLTGMPVSYGWRFDHDDLEELIFLIKEGGSDGTGAKTIPRPSRVRQMLASRACRSAVMIGKALDYVDMHRLLTQMSQMKNPWNCPHGRPTLRHLLSLTLLKR